MMYGILWARDFSLNSWFNEYETVDLPRDENAGVLCLKASHSCHTTWRLPGVLCRLNMENGR